jgi:CTP synthase
MNAETPYPVIAMMEDQKNITNKGGTMRLGAYPCDLKKGQQGCPGIRQNTY